MKKILVLMLAILLLAACSEDVFEGETPDEAFINLQADFIKELTDLQTAEVSDTQYFGVFKAVISGEPEVFVAYAESVEGKWRVMEAIAVGHELKDDLPPAKGQFIEGEIIDAPENLTEVTEENGVYMFKLPTSERAVTVKFK